ncbi:MAG: VacJ family lipoprotein [Gammaproteobacteria bacterium]|nr:VacJ family lipoprotein [Gammaproteobacteria bacterium]NIR85868.1 VacJ family lipoprotein [Gammaproteobacteria bacterium]NIU07029.1 VacJ family lipoprotein [Gammaproteobacteria bacterium]NIV53524.1 VacJ family lipoprotein [Gammaproteobacteria bacterium]NIV76041.1 VacJ family lipoprotein [Gammaproteobacteria bacterium]
MFPAPYRGLRAALLAGMVGVLPACATTADGPAEPDPFETGNRKVYRFNDGLDRYALKPAADAYVKVAPGPVRTSVSNFFGNLTYLDVILNDFFQGKPEQGVRDSTRFFFNTTFGVLGVFDFAGNYMGLPAREEDFGQTLAVWGSGVGPYLVYPLVGPSTARDTAGLLFSFAIDPTWYLSDMAASISLAVLRVVNARAELSGIFRLRDAAAVDPYAFTREAYLQRRRFLIHDGNPPRPNYLDFEEEAAPPAEAPR